MKPIQVEFFHDVVCGWCYLQSPRLRKVAAEFNANVIQRTFVLQRNQQEMVQRFGSIGAAKREILGHWKSCRTQAEDPSRFNIEGMQQQTFDYPNGWQGTLACKAAEQLAGHPGHWDMFDRIQLAHLKENRNVGTLKCCINWHWS